MTVTETTTPAAADRVAMNTEPLTTLVARPGVVVLRGDTLTTLGPTWVTPTPRPDFYTYEIRIRIRDRTLDTTSWSKYVAAWRGCNTTAEDLAAEIRDTLVAVLQPDAVTVRVTQNVHGGSQLTVQYAHNGGMPDDDLE